MQHGLSKIALELSLRVGGGGRERDKHCFLMAFQNIYLYIKWWLSFSFGCAEGWVPVCFAHAGNQACMFSKPLIWWRSPLMEVLLHTWGLSLFSVQFSFSPLYKWKHPEVYPFQSLGEAYLLINLFFFYFFIFLVFLVLRLEVNHLPCVGEWGVVGCRDGWWRSRVDKALRWGVQLSQKYRASLWN